MASELTATIVTAATEAQAAIDRKLRSCPDIAGTPLEQAGLKDGLQIVCEYVSAGEAGVALDHLRYMITETEVLLSTATRAALDEVCRRLKVPRVAMPTEGTDAREEPDDTSRRQGLLRENPGS